MKALFVSAMHMCELRILASYLAREAYKDKTSLSCEQIANYLRTEFGGKFGSTANNQLLGYVKISVGKLVAKGYLKPAKAPNQFHVTEFGYDIGRQATREAERALNDQDRLRGVIPRQSSVSA